MAGPMSAAGPKRGEIQAALVAMALEAKEAKQIAGGSVTEVVTGWVAARYAQAAREQLAEREGEERLELLHTLAQDWALLRKGDQTAERLDIERERLLVEQKRQLYAENDSVWRWKTKMAAGLDTINTYVAAHPKARAAFDAFLEQLPSASPEIQKWKDLQKSPLPVNPTESD
ncbi:MAG: hypothetical protein K8R23_06710 [Chthoniobacter sp.]|nr:hypothetical protein [Chthoniobacter sp.]